MDEEDATQVDMPAISSSYETAGPTLQDHPSPFARRKATKPGMPVVGSFDAEITTKGPPPDLDGVLTPPAVKARELDTDDSLAGATLPEGFPALQRPADPTRRSSITFDDEDALTVRTDRPVRARPKGRVPKPGEPLVQVSPSLELQVAHLDDPSAPLDPQLAAAAQGSRRLKSRVEQPTEVMLPALKAKPKEGSDRPLMVLLGVVAVVILLLAGAVVWGVLRSF